MLTELNRRINAFVWGAPMVMLLAGTGILMTVRTRGFQVFHLKHWMQKTLGSIFLDRRVTEHTGGEDPSISQFQSMCTALAATIGTGNIIGVASALICGGPGAIFWMWVVAFFGMMTSYSENVLGIYYRSKNERGEWCGGAMYYLRDGLGSQEGMKEIGSALAVLFSLFCLLASFGIGNMSQVNSIACNLKTAFGIPSLATGVILTVLAALTVLGGIKRIARVTERLVPFMALVYLAGALLVCIAHADQFGAVFQAIFRGAFGIRAVGGGLAASEIKRAVTWGMKRGIFSNEAGLGSSVMVHASSNVKEPVCQGMWGIFEVFADTIVVCTLTAFSVLSSGLFDLRTGELRSSAEGSALVGEAFSTVFGNAGPMFIAAAILLFAFSTVLGWSHYGAKAFEYLFGSNHTIVYRLLFLALIFCGSVMNLELAWDLSDTFNGLMAIPNLMGVICLSPEVVKITRNYVSRKLHQKAIPPMLSAFADIQKEQEQRT